MGLNRAFDRGFFVIGGAVKKSGSSFNLGKGQLALIDRSKTTAQGAEVVNTVAGKPKDAKDFVLRCGISQREPNRSYTNKDESSMPFSLNEIVDLKVSAPENTEQKVDEVIIGYNGVNANTAFSFKTGDAYFRLSLELTGGAVAYRGGKGDKEVVNINVEVPECDPFNNCDTCDECEAVDCKVVTLEAIERLKRKQLTGGMTVDQLVDITPVFSCDTPPALTEIPWDYFCLEVCDTGSDAALAMVQTQYDVPVVRTDRVGSTSTYQILQSSTVAAPVDYDQTLASIIKGCADCPAGWTESPEGVLYAFTIEDDGVDLSASFEALPGYVAGTVTVGENNAGVGFYTAIFDDALTSAEITAFLTAGAPNNTATFEEVGNVAAICSNDTVTSTAWVACGQCNVIEETYTITIPDDECGEPITDILNANYDTVVTYVSSAACQSTYETTVVSNIVCDECDPIFKDYYVTEAPDNYDIYAWELVPTVGALPDGNCLCGIKIKAKPFILEGEECLRDLVGFTETSVQIRVAAGYPEEIREGIGTLPEGTYPTTYLSRWTPRTHLGGELRDLENESRAYFRGVNYRGGKMGYLGRLLRGETSNIEDQSVQYVQYTLTVSHFNHTQGFAGRINEDINYDIWVEVGRHADVEALLNNIASAAGVATVQAFGA